MHIVNKFLQYRDHELAANPRRVSSWDLDPPYEGYRSVRLGGQYRAIIEIDDDELTVTVVAIGHRADIYRPGSAR
jgi:mRNA-degrading endonuclease RelE of RelBE toxin-antitoxin system